MSILRPVTAKWHRAHSEGRLNSRDGADEFRGDLAEVQKKLRAFASRLHEMAYGSVRTDASDRPAVMTNDELEDVLPDRPPSASPEHR